MKNIFLSLVALLFVTAINAQNLPDIKVKDLNGKPINVKEIVKNDGNPVVIAFWATWCKPCIKELDAFNENLPDWEEETGVKIIAISIDEARSLSRVAPLANGRAWEFDIYTDSNSDFKRAMNVNNPPHTIILDGNGKIVYQHSSYNEGDEEHTFEIIQKIANGESLK